jgi:hypothetical protein
MSFVATFNLFVSKMDAFLELVGKACDCEPTCSSLVDEVIFDDLSRCEVVSAFKAKGSNISDSDLLVGAGATMTDLYEKLQKKGSILADGEEKRKRENLYFKRLLQGVDLRWSLFYFLFVV